MELNTAKYFGTRDTIFEQWNCLTSNVGKKFMTLIFFEFTYYVNLDAYNALIPIKVIKFGALNFASQEQWDSVWFLIFSFLFRKIANHNVKLCNYEYIRFGEFVSAFKN